MQNLRSRIKEIFEKEELFDIGLVSVLLGNALLSHHLDETELRNNEDFFQLDKKRFIEDIKKQNLTNIEDIINFYHRRIVKFSHFENETCFIPQMYQAFVNARRKNPHAVTLQVGVDLFHNEKTSLRWINCETATTFFMSIYETLKKELLLKDEVVACVSLGHFWIGIKNLNLHFHISNPSSSDLKIQNEDLKLDILSNLRNEKDTFWTSPYHVAGVLCENFIHFLIDRIHFETNKACYIKDLIDWIELFIQLDPKINILKSSKFWLFIGDAFCIPVLGLEENKESLNRFINLVKNHLNLEENSSLEKLAEACFVKSGQLNSKYFKPFLKLTRLQNLDNNLIKERIEFARQMIKKEKEKRLDSKQLEITKENREDILQEFEQYEVELARSEVLFLAKCIIQSKDDNTDSLIDKFLELLWKYALFPEPELDVPINLEEDFSVDVHCHEKQKGDAGFINLNFLLFKDVFNKIKSLNELKFKEFLGKHEYVLALLIQGDVLDMNRQAWARRNLDDYQIQRNECSRTIHEDLKIPFLENGQNVFVCITCVKKGERAGVCEHCATHCHRAFSHHLVHIGKKKNFMCDCGSDKYHSCCTLTNMENNYKNVYNHNFDAPPRYCYEGVCIFGNSDEDVLMNVKFSDLSEPIYVSGAEVVQCEECFDWFHPVCCFETKKEIDELENTNFICVHCQENKKRKLEEPKEENVSKKIKL